ncbi:DUF982 domain-containing protein [Chelativorans sp. AA-79]|uniref:DUF982 domain-containing protein n=1 Tax=Chelativorans sp. AA-79 TaxID=3028735 RepID=UPI0023F9FCE6|nr:DUF982 domain-containing protein [Chelativorans sp. AA-79]WEX10020.1 DUF982 domain-containing protein [Chelativorans sp. AA-79]
MNQEQSTQPRFETPVRITLRPGKTKEIANAREAFDFLRTCPVQEGPIFESALEACFVATYRSEAVGEARRSLKTFAKAHGFIA